MEVRAAVLILLYCSNKIQADKRPQRNSIFLKDYRFPPSNELFANDGKDECRGVPNFNPNRFLNFRFVLEDGETIVQFNSFTQNFEHSGYGWEYKGRIGSGEIIDSQFVTGCKQFWMEIDDDVFTSYECCESNGFSYRLREGTLKGEAILQGYISKNCFEGEFCKPQARCQKCKNDNGGVGTTKFYLHTKPGQWSGLLEICGGSGIESLGIRYPMEVYAEGISKRLYIKLS